MFSDEQQNTRRYRSVLTVHVMLRLVPTAIVIRSLGVQFPRYSTANHLYQRLICPFTHHEGS